MKPATPPPWVKTATYVDARDGAGNLRYPSEEDPETHHSVAKTFGQHDDANAAYIVHAANAYPELVAALRVLTDVCDNVPVFQLDDGKASVRAVRLAGKFTSAHTTARALLAKLDK